MVSLHAQAAPDAEMVVTDADRQHWAFLPLAAVTPPETEADAAAWVRTPVDAFIRHAQESESLSPSPQADARTLVRRLYFDLVGLPPTPEEMERWSLAIEKSSGTASAALVDELLASPQHGERWARHWLDVARYADSNGMEGDHDRPNAYRFRDFVISALNDDLPFNTFVRWQLAGDEIAPDNPKAIAATGFLTAGHSTLIDVPMEEEKLRYRANELDDIVSTTGQGLLALTLACARCHDHKYDPIPSRDYYRLMRIFNSGDRKEVPLASPSEIKAQRAATATWQAEREAAVKQRDEWMNHARPPLEDKVRAAKIEQLTASDAEKQLLRGNPEDPGAKTLAERFKNELGTATADYIVFLTEEQKAHWDKLALQVNAIEKR
ncbi:MAG: DUF1549 domain-containing protein, partial [Verrucomicrobia bacterium]|nr:DUF1549 domain-containing protein [Verrucomicrobiota bacterium]